MRDETIAIHGGYVADSTRAVAVPVYQTVAHDFIDADHAAAVFDLEQPGFHYNRINNPTTDVLEQRMAMLEGGTAAVAVSSGAAAVSLAVRNLTTPGANIVSAPQLYGATYTLFAEVLAAEGVSARFGATDRPDDLAGLIDVDTRLVFAESVGNPAGNIADIAALAELAHGHGVPLIVDNTVATPLMLKPFQHGADVVVHSLTKFVGGHGTTLGGIVIDGGRFPWLEHADRFPMLTRPEPAFHGVVYAEQFPASPYAVRLRTVGVRNHGSSLSPFNAFLLLQGLETLSVRLDRHGANVAKVAAYLLADPRVEWVSWSGLPEHAHHQLAQRYLGGRFPSILTFGVTGGYPAGIRFFNATKLFKRLVNMGDAKSLVSHPSSTTHRQLDPDAQRLVGITPEMIRLSVGIEHIEDLLADLDQALAAAVVG